MTTCPWCKRKSITTAQRLSVWWNQPIVCERCGKQLVLVGGWSRLVAIPLLFAVSATFFSMAFQFRDFLVAPWSAYAGATLGLVASAFIHYMAPLEPASNAEVKRRKGLAYVLLAAGVPLMVLWVYFWL